MQRRRNVRGTGAPLFVKEVILPEKEKPGFSQNLKRIPSLLSVDAKKIESIDNSSHNYVKTGDPEVKPICGLVILEKKLQEPYFKGTRKKEHTRRKAKNWRATHSTNELDFKGLQNEAEGSENQTPSEDFVLKEDIIQLKKLQQKIQGYEKMREYSEKMNDIKQRLTEEKYLQQQENLVKTWCLKKKNQPKEVNYKDNFPHPKSACTKTFYNNNITVSTKSEKFRSDKKVKKIKGKPQRLLKREVVDDDLGEEFMEKLVFVNDESNNETKNIQKTYHSKYFRRKN